MAPQNAGKAAPDLPGNSPLDAHSLAACCNLHNSAAGPRRKRKSAGGSAPRSKGNRFERTIVKLLQDRGSWLQGRDALVIRADRHDALVILPLRLAAEIAIAAERRKP